MPFAVHARCQTPFTLDANWCSLNENTHSSKVSFNQYIYIAPESVIGNPESVIGNPESVIGNPESVIGNPESVIGNPESVIVKP